MELEHSTQSAFDTFSAEGWVTGILDTIKSGKEATVYSCKAGPRVDTEFVALKVYRDLKHRNFRNDSIYQEGRVIGDGRVARAMKKKTPMGQVFHLLLWVDHEYETLCALYNAGAGVPKPVTKTANAILMEYLGDAEAVASPLNMLDFSPEEARGLFDGLMQEIELWLACDIVHADLSAYNIVHWQGRPMVIDFPQAIDPRFNPHALDLLTRDITNLCTHFRKYGIQSDGAEIARSLWERYKLGEL
jgi:RIO kinase 1